MSAQTKTKISAKPPKAAKSAKAEKPGKLPAARLVKDAGSDIDDDAEDKQRSGVQSLGRAFGILEEIARHRDGIGLADLSKLVGLHNSTTFHLAKTMVSLGYIRQEKDTKRSAMRSFSVKPIMAVLDKKTILFSDGTAANSSRTLYECNTAPLLPSRYESAAAVRRQLT
ncbi:MAG: helix-turn-helix domain-containing protein [Hyphomicrobiales bacterium]